MPKAPQWTDWGLPLQRVENPYLILANIDGLWHHGGKLTYPAFYNLRELKGPNISAWGKPPRDWFTFKNLFKPTCPDNFYRETKSSSNILPLAKLRRAFMKIMDAFPQGGSGKSPWAGQKNVSPGLYRAILSSPLNLWHVPRRIILGLSYVNRDSPAATTLLPYEAIISVHMLPAG